MVGLHRIQLLICGKVTCALLCIAQWRHLWTGG